MDASTVYALIQSTPDAVTAYDAADDAGTADVLNAASIRKTDSTKRDANWLINSLSEGEADLVLGTLQASTIPRVKAAVETMYSGGVDLSNAQVQRMIPDLGAAGSWPQGLIDSVMQHGVWSVSPAIESMGESVVTQDVTDARRWKTLRSRANDNYNAAADAIDDGSAADWAAVVALLRA